MHAPLQCPHSCEPCRSSPHRRTAGTCLELQLQGWGAGKMGGKARQAPTTTMHQQTLAHLRRTKLSCTAMRTLPCSPHGRHVPFTAPHQRLQAVHAPVRLVQFLQYESGHWEHSPSAVA